MRTSSRYSLDRVCGSFGGVGVVLQRLMGLITQLSIYRRRHYRRCCVRGKGKQWVANGHHRRNGDDPAGDDRREHASSKRNAATSRGEWDMIAATYARKSTDERSA